MQNSENWTVCFTTSSLHCFQLQKISLFSISIWKMHFKLNLFLLFELNRKLFSFYSRRVSDLSTWPRWRLTTRRPTEPTWRLCAARCPICWAWSCPRRSQTSWKRARKGSKNPKPKFWVSLLCVFYVVTKEVTKLKIH